MTFTECPRETEVVEAIGLGRLEPALHDHIAACATCAEVAEIARALHDDRAAACHDAHVPAAGMVWWRATIRARAEASRTAAQPITVLQGIAGACAVGLGCGLVSVVLRSTPLAERLTDMARQFEAGRVESVALVSPILAYGVPLIFAVAACLVIAPLALYFTLGDE